MFRQALAQAPDFRDGHYNLGVALNSLDRVEEAVESFERSLEIDPEFQDARDRLGEIRASGLQGR